MMARYIKRVGDISEEIEGTAEEIIQILKYLDNKEMTIDRNYKLTLGGDYIATGTIKEIKLQKLSEKD